jgi:SAM-dependent methyltransferase
LSSVLGVLPATANATIQQMTARMPSEGAQRSHDLVIEPPWGRIRRYIGILTTTPDGDLAKNVSMQRGLAFDRVAELYDRARPGYPERLIDAALGDQRVRDVLEVGCGPGRLTAALVARGLHVEAIEPGANLAAIARRRMPEVEVQVARFEELELAEASFDVVFSATAFHWVDPGIGWAKAARVLRPRGTLALLSYVYVTDDETRPSQEALRDLYRAPWQLRDERDVVEGALARVHNISAVWAWLEDPAIEVDEAGQLFGRARFVSVPHRVDLGAAELIDLQRTTATHLSLDADGQERVERGMVELVEQLGGTFPIRQLAVLAAAERR